MKFKENPLLKMEKNEKELKQQQETLQKLI